MSFQAQVVGQLDYDRCTYGTSRLSFRGPFRTPQAIDVAVLGGTQTFGKYIPNPYPALLEETLGRPVVNLGALSAGLDSLIAEPVIEEVVHRTRVAVVQVPGAHAQSNPFYKVHRRQNERFIAPTDKLTKLFPEVDFANYTYVRHLVESLQARCENRFDVVRRALCQNWLEKMDHIIGRLAMPTVLLWFSDEIPRSDGVSEVGGNPSAPLFVTRAMVREMAVKVDKYVEIVRLPAGPKDQAHMVFPELERPAAAQVLGPSAHVDAARILAKEIGPIFEPFKLTKERKRAPGRP